MPWPRWGNDADIGYIFCFSPALPPFFTHSSRVIESAPLPLHEFSPAQLFCAVAHEPLPLQSLMPSHITLSLPLFSVCDSARTPIAPAMMSVAAALAMTRLLFRMRFLLGGRPLGAAYVSHNRRVPPLQRGIHGTRPPMRTVC